MNKAGKMTPSRFNFRMWDGLRMEGPFDLASGDGLSTQHACAGARYKLLQSTGIVDKNGKEIYEGDLLCVNGPPHRLIIEMRWWPEAARFQTFCLNAPTISDARWEVFYDKDHPGQLIDVEIIGNIYQNPELLGEQNDLQINPPT